MRFSAGWRPAWLGSAPSLRSDPLAPPVELARLKVPASWKAARSRVPKGTLVLGEPSPRVMAEAKTAWATFFTSSCEPVTTVQQEG